MIRWAPLVLLAACKGNGARKPPAACERLTFAETVPVAEASGALVTELDGRAVVLVTGDSGTLGAFVFVDAETGEKVAEGNLPLGDGASDDVEGISWQGADLVGITSAGWVRRWTRDGASFALADGPYAIGEVDETLPGLGVFEVADPGVAPACAATTVNCGKNYEAFCLGPVGDCAGFAGSKSDGHLYCLHADGDRLRIDTAHPIEVSAPNTLAGCDIVDGVVWAATNGFDGRVFQVRGTKVTEVPIPPEGFPEAIAAGRDGVVYRFQDTSGFPSAAERWRCR